MYKIYANGELLHDPRLSLDGLVVADPSVTMQINSHGSAEFTVPVSNPLYSAIQPLTTMISIWDDAGEMFRGRVLEVEKDFYNSLKVYCEGALAFLLDTVKEAHSFNGKAANLFRALITQHSAAMPENKRFTVGEISAVYENTTIVYDEEEALSTWEMLNTHLLDNIGGFIRSRAVDGVLYIDYLADYAGTSSQGIRFGENLLDMERGASGADIFTRLIPYGKRLDSGKRVNITSVNGGVNYLVNSDLEAKYGVIYRTEVFDDAETAADLLAAAQSRIAQPAMTQTVEATALDLHLVDPSIERIEVGQFFRLYSVPHDVSTLMLCSKIAYDLGDPSKTKITLGQLSDTITSQVASGVTSSASSGGSGGSGDLTAIEIATEAKEIAEQAQVDAQTAVSTANSASASAESAAQTASSAKTAADAAASDASAAKTTAQNAMSAANSASTAASGASKIANAAKATADSASATAAEAQTAAEDASAAAESAGATATAAQTAAANAQTTADAANALSTEAKAAAADALETATSANEAAESALNTASDKAPKMHTSPSGEYGLGQIDAYGHVMLSDSVNSTSGVSSGVAATPAAVKQAYDIASAAQSKADSAHTTANGAQSEAQDSKRLAQNAAATAATALTAAEEAETTAESIKGTADAALTASQTAQSAAEAAQSAVGDKAPISHASNATTYGKSTSSLYGHVKLSDSVSSTLSAASGGTAATPASVKKVHDLLGGAKVITGTATIDYGTSMKYADVTFGYTFQNPPFVIAMQVFNGIPLACMIGSVTKTGARFSLQGDFTSSGSREFRWLAIGV